jgi:hypothetical protein
MPINGYPAGFTNSWPAILHEYLDRTAYEDDPVWKAERAAESNWTKPRPWKRRSSGRRVTWVTSRGCFGRRALWHSCALAMAIP